MKNRWRDEMIKNLTEVVKRPSKQKPKTWSSPLWAYPYDTIPLSVCSYCKQPDLIKHITCALGAPTSEFEHAFPVCE